MLKQIIIKLDVNNGSAHWDEVVDDEAAAIELLENAIQKIRKGQYHTVPNQKTSSAQIYDSNGHPTGKIYVIRKGKN